MKGLLRSFLRPKNLTLSEWGNLLELGFNGAPATSGVFVSEGTAMRISTVWSCQRLLTETVMGLPLESFKRLEGEAREKDPGFHVARILAAPNPEMTLEQLLEFIMMRLLSRGNAYIRIRRFMNGRPAEFWPIAGEVFPERPDPLGPIVYQVMAPRKPGGTDTVMETLDPDDVWHVPGLAFNGLVGLNPIEHARNMFGLALATEEHGSRLFSNGARPSGLLSTPGVLKKGGWERVRKDWQEVYGGVHNAGKTVVLEHGMTYQAMGLSNEDAQFLETRQFQGEEVARFYRVPPHMVGLAKDLPRANMEQQGREFRLYSIHPWTVRIVSSAHRQVFLERDRRSHFLAFDTAELEAPDAETKSKVWAVERNWGLSNSNEIRARKNMNPIEGGDEYMVPGNMVPLGEVGSTGGEKGPGSQQGIRQDQELSARERAMIRDTARRAVKRELGYLSKLDRGKATAKGLVEWYGRHAEFLSRALHIPLDAAHVFTRCRCAAVALAVEEERLGALIEEFQEDDGEALTQEVIHAGR